MNKKISINAICDPNSTRIGTQEPFLFNDYVCATNGHMLMLHKNTSTSDYKTLPNKTVNAAAAFIIKEINTTADFKPVLKYVHTTTCAACAGTGLCIKTTCQECNGKQVVCYENHHNAYEMTCKSCHGDGGKTLPSTKKTDTCTDCHGYGQRALNPTIKLNAFNITINPNYLLLVQGIPGVTFAVSKDRTRLLFKSTDIIGGIATIREGNS